MKKPNRIYILGTVGSGKSFLGNRLCRDLGVRHYDLDDIYWQVKYSKRRNVKTRAKKLKEIIKKKQWVIDGVYGDWVDSALEKSDVVIVLDFPLDVLVWRIFKKLMKNGRMKDFNKLVRYAKRYKKDKSSYGFEHHMKLAMKHNPGCLLIKNNKQLNKFMESLEK